MESSLESSLESSKEVCSLENYLNFCLSVKLLISPSNVNESLAV